MLAARFYGAGDIRIEEIKKPRISKDEILVKVKSAALCGTDLRMYRHGLANNASLPITLGHEFSGVIAAVGAEVSHYTEGMEVVVAPNMGCGVCRQCVQGNTHHCPDYKALGIHLDGGFAEYVRIPKEAVVQGNVTPIPAGLSFEEAALVEPLSSVYSGLERCQVGLGDYVLIIGGGPIGIMHAKLALLAGAAKVLLNDRNQSRRDLAVQVDSRIIPLQSDDLVEQVQNATKGEGLDVCIIAAPSPEAQSLSLQLMAQNGRVNFFGGLPKEAEIVPLNSNLIHYKQLLVTGTTRASLGQFRKCLDLVAAELVDLQGLITGRYSLSEFAVALATAGSSQGYKSMVNFVD